MRLIGHLPDEPEARRFVDYLVAHRMAAHAEEQADGAWQIWIENDDAVDAGRAELQQFVADPNDARYNAAGEAERLRRAEAKAAQRRQANYRDVRTTLFTRPHGATPVTYAVIGLCVAIFVILKVGSTKPNAADDDNSLHNTVLRTLMFSDWNNVPDETEPTVLPPAVPAISRTVMFHDVLHGQVWRLVSPAFLHLNFLHILFNLMWMLDLGRRIEPVKGSGTMILLVLATAAFSCVAEAVWSAVSPWNPIHYEFFLGLSGVVSGLFGYCWAVGRYRPYERIGVGAQETGYMLGWLIICTFGFVGPIANAAHWGGLVLGGLIGAAPSLWKRRG